MSGNNQQSPSSSDIKLIRSETNAFLLVQLAFITAALMSLDCVACVESVNQQVRAGDGWERGGRVAAVGDAGDLEINKRSVPVYSHDRTEWGDQKELLNVNPADAHISKVLLQSRQKRQAKNNTSNAPPPSTDNDDSSNNNADLPLPLNDNGIKGELDEEGIKHKESDTNANVGSNDTVNAGQSAVMSNEILINHEYTTVKSDMSDKESNLAATDPNYISPCPSTDCDCHMLVSKLSNHRLKSLDCTGLGLTTIALGDDNSDNNNIPLWTEMLKLTSNRIEIETLSDIKQFVSLQELHIESNHIYTLQDWFPLSSSLSYLSLDRNEIDYLANATFMGVPNLIYLSSVQNKIEVIHRNAFSTLTKLERLILDGNRISEIDARWFRNMDSLRALHLGSNNIHTLEDGSLRYLMNLEKLDLSGNHLHSVHNRAFIGLKKLKELYLQHNSIYTVPTVAFQIFSNCDIIDVSANHIDAIEAFGVSYINVTHMKFNSMPTLHMLDTHSFSNLPYLKFLEITRNKNLLYIDRESFVNVPCLEKLLLNGNALSTLEKEVGLSMTTSLYTLTATRTADIIKEIDISDNPLYCDCVLMWLTDKLFLHNSNITVINGNITVCHLPADMSDVLLKDLKLKPSLVKAANTVGCAPRIITSLFKSHYNTSLGDSFKISCKATGVPLPSVEWYLPTNHKRKLEKQAMRKSNSVRHTNLPTDQLFINFAEREDQGNYSCVAKNSIDTVTTSTFLFIQMSSAYLIISKLTDTSVTMTWARTHHARDYELVYHPDVSSANFSYRSVKIEPYMREYTLSGLHPNTKYVICISVNYLGKHIPINCTDVNTRDMQFIKGALHSSKNFVITGAISVLLIIVLLVCIVGYFSRRYNKKKEREHKLYTDSMSQLYPGSLDSISDTTPITYENKIAEMFDLDDNYDIASTSDQTTSLA